MVFHWSLYARMRLMYFNLFKFYTQNTPYYFNTYLLLYLIIILNMLPHATVSQAILICVPCGNRILVTQRRKPVALHEPYHQIMYTTWLIFSCTARCDLV